MLVSVWLPVLLIGSSCVTGGLQSTAKTPPSSASAFQCSPRTTVGATGTVVDEDGEPMQGVVVTLLMGEQQVAQVSTDREGHFNLSCLLQDQVFELSFSFPDSGPIPMTLPAARSFVYDLSIQYAGTIVN